MAGRASDYLVAAGLWRGRKSKGETFTGGCGSSSMVILSVRRSQEEVNLCYSCTRHSTCFTKGPSEWACECRNAGLTCTGCMCWAKCRNKGRILPSPTTVRGLLGHFLCGTIHPNLSLPVRASKNSSMQAILAARLGKRGCRLAPASAGA